LRENQSQGYIRTLWELRAAALFYTILTKRKKRELLINHAFSSSFFYVEQKFNDEKKS